ncbi:MAG: J domain-containing protein [Tepidiformaceae bacterium]
MADSALIDYYAILNLPPRADLPGVENAYARLSDELARRMEIDDTSGDALRRVNEAYSILSRPELRREYDRAFFAKEIAEAERLWHSAERRRLLAGRLMMTGLVAVIAVQAGVLIYIGMGHF